MFHPLAPDLSNVKDDELYEKVNEINRKINMAWRLGSNGAIQQMQMLLSHYQEELQNRHRAKLAEIEANNKNFKNIIDIK